MAGAFALIALAPLLHRPAGGIRSWSLLVSAGFAALAWLAPRALAPLNRLWAAFGLLLHRLVSPVVLSLLFFCTIAPVGLLMRLFGQDPLRLRRDSSAASYWVRREPPGPAPETMKNQF